MVAQAVTISLSSSTVSLPLGGTGPPASLQGLQDWVRSKMDAVDWCRLSHGSGGVTVFDADRIDSINRVDAARGKETQLRPTAERGHSGVHPSLPPPPAAESMLRSVAGGGSAGLLRRLLLSADDWQDGMAGAGACLLGFVEEEGEQLPKEQLPASLVLGGWWRMEAFTADHMQARSCSAAPPPQQYCRPKATTDSLALPVSWARPAATQTSLLGCGTLSTAHPLVLLARLPASPCPLRRWRWRCPPAAR